MSDAAVRPKMRPELPPLPEKMRNLPISDRGYPVPYFVAWLQDGLPQVRGVGQPDFRVVHPGAREDCWQNNRCWLCGGKLGAYRAFTSGPMCGVNRTSAEPPSHRECATYAATACPFLVRPHAKRRDVSEEVGQQEMPGHGLMRNPGVALVWVTKRPGVFPDGNGSYLFDMGEPHAVEFYAEGRKATRAEVVHSIETGEPFLREMAVAEGPSAERSLDRMLEAALALIPEDE